MQSPGMTIHYIIAKVAVVDQPVLEARPLITQGKSKEYL